MLFSNFGDIFDVRHFITSLRDEVRIVKRLPKKFGPTGSSIILEMPPVSWSDEKYYLHQVCQLIWDPSMVHALVCTLHSLSTHADLTTLQQI
jgi:hypothetical protein